VEGRHEHAPGAPLDGRGLGIHRNVEHAVARTEQRQYRGQHGQARAQHRLRHRQTEGRAAAEAITRLPQRAISQPAVGRATPAAPDRFAAAGRIAGRAPRVHEA
jgi:hypothetical protein